MAENNSQNRSFIPTRPAIIVVLRDSVFFIIIVIAAGFIFPYTFVRWWGPILFLALLGGGIVGRMLWIHYSLIYIEKNKGVVLVDDLWGDKYSVGGDGQNGPRIRDLAKVPEDANDIIGLERRSLGDFTTSFRAHDGVPMKAKWSLSYRPSMELLPKFQGIDPAAFRSGIEAAVSGLVSQHGSSLTSAKASAKKEFNRLIRADLVSTGKVSEIAEEWGITDLIFNLEQATTSEDHNRVLESNKQTEMIANNAIQLVVPKMPARGSVEYRGLLLKAQREAAKGKSATTAVTFTTPDEQDAAVQSMIGVPYEKAINLASSIANQTKGINLTGSGAKGVKPFFNLNQGGGGNKNSRKKGR